jgi:hypothetical protein
MVGEQSCCPVFGTLHTRRSPSAVWVASMSVFCFDEEPCHDKPVILDGALDVVNVCSMVNAGCNVATNIEPLRYLQKSATSPRRNRHCTDPIANVLQSFAGAIAVMGSNMVRVETCSDVDDSNRVIEPCVLPVTKLAYTSNTTCGGYYQMRCCHSA